MHPRSLAGSFSPAPHLFPSSHPLTVYACSPQAEGVHPRTDADLSSLRRHLERSVRSALAAHHPHVVMTSMACMRGCVLACIHLVAVDLPPTTTAATSAPDAPTPCTAAAAADDDTASHKAAAPASPVDEPALQRLLATAVCDALAAVHGDTAGLAELGPDGAPRPMVVTSTLTPASRLQLDGQALVLGASDADAAPELQQVSVRDAVRGA